MKPKTIFCALLIFASTCQIDAQTIDECYTWKFGFSNASLCLNDDGTFKRAWGACTEAGEQCGYYELIGDTLFMCVTNTQYHYRNEYYRDSIYYSVNAQGLLERHSSSVKIITNEGVDPDSYTYFFKEGFLYYKRHDKLPHYRINDRVYPEGLKNYNELSNEAATMMILGRYL